MCHLDSLVPYIGDKIVSFRFTCSLYRWCKCVVQIHLFPIYVIKMCRSDSLFPYIGGTVYHICGAYVLFRVDFPVYVWYRSLVLYIYGRNVSFMLTFPV